MGAFRYGCFSDQKSLVRGSISFMRVSFAARISQLKTGFGDISPVNFSLNTNLYHIAICFVFALRVLHFTTCLKCLKMWLVMCNSIL